LKNSETILKSDEIVKNNYPCYKLFLVEEPFNQINLVRWNFKSRLIFSSNFKKGNNTNINYASLLNESAYFNFHKLSLCLPVFLSFCLFVFLSLCLFVFLAYFIFFFLAYCLSVFLSFCPLSFYTF
jgi:hypothetical protein